ncbi:MAG: hypothetical protein KDK91_18885 [Gammaproteobacteria bacterium]|nr:hypothetical protein [Gammaproteobacteria bacterium]
MLEWLLKYPVDWYQRGDITLAWSMSQLLAAIALTGLLALTLSGYLARRDVAGSRWLPSLLRASLVGLLLLALARPVLEVEVEDSIPGHVAVLIDDSLSMRVRDSSGQTRAQRIEALLRSDQAILGSAVDRRVDVRRYAFGSELRALDAEEPLRFDTTRSDPGAALEALTNGADIDSLAAVVLVGDGGHDASEPARLRLQRALVKLRGAGIPVHTVDAGASRAAPDVSVQSVTLPGHVISGDAFDVELLLWHNLREDREVMLSFEDDGILIDRAPVRLREDMRELRVLHRLRLVDGGPHRLSVRLEPIEGETLLENNLRERHIEVHEEPIRVLHFEGEPRFEVKFLRRAVADDPRIRLTSLIRTADNKYYRLGVQSADELADGFPLEIGDLFRFDVLVLGSAGADLLDARAQENIRAFVARRGGGLVLLGGRQAFAEGGYAQTPLAGLMPVILSAAAPAFNLAVKVRATSAGRSDPLLDLGGTESVDRLLERLPELSVVNPHRSAKPGARVLLEAPDSEGHALIIMARHRFGRGSVTSFAVRNSWRWQMHADVPVEDQTHEMLWRQLLRDAGREAGGRLRVQLPTLKQTRTLAPGQSVQVIATALDETYQPLQDGAPSLLVVDPTGRVDRLIMSPSGQAPGQYQSAFVTGRAGHYELSVHLPDSARTGTTDGQTAVGAGPGLENGPEAPPPEVERHSVRTHLDVVAEGDEYTRNAEDTRLLAGIAAQTGGSAIDADALGELRQVIDAGRGTNRHRERLPLWDVPLLLAGIVLLALAEWAVRRRRRLP